MPGEKHILRARAKCLFYSPAEMLHFSIYMVERSDYFNKISFTLYKRNTPFTTEMEVRGCALKRTPLYRQWYESHVP